MPVSSISQVDGFSVIVKGGRTIDCSTIKIAGSGGQAGKNDRLKAALQFLLDDLTPLADLPAEDSHKTTDPSTNREFWDAGGVNLVTRTVECTEVFFDGAGLSVGIYFIRLDSTGQSEMKKMVLVR